MKKYITIVFIASAITSCEQKSNTVTTSNVKDSAHLARQADSIRAAMQHSRDSSEKLMEAVSDSAKLNVNK